ncbi:MAG: holo-ACP synthase [Candidatus Pristimantibacillus sp.]
MIVGVGHDITDMDRIASLLKGNIGERFKDRILTKREQELAVDYRGNRLVQFVAGRFAAKEAVVKAIGCGIGAKVGFCDIAILRDINGKPEIVLSNEAWRRLELEPEQIRMHITITHDRSIASAVAIMESMELQ